MINPCGVVNTKSSLMANRDWPQEKRDKLPNKDFAGPDESFPITTQADVDAAAKLIGHAKDPEAVKARIISIAKKKNLSIPEAWQSTTNSIDEDEEELEEDEDWEFDDYEEADDEIETETEEAEMLIDNGGPGSGPRPGGGKGKTHWSNSKSQLGKIANSASRIALSMGKKASNSGKDTAHSITEEAISKAVKSGDHLQAAKLHQQASENHRRQAQVNANKKVRFDLQSESYQDSVFQHGVAGTSHAAAASKHLMLHKLTNNNSETKDDHVGTSTTLDEGVANMAKLSVDERKTIVNELVKNCSCQEANMWSEEDRATLMTFNDAKLTTLKKQREKMVSQEAVVNAVKQGFGDISVNEMPAALLAAKKAKGRKVVEENDDEEDEGEEEVPVKNQSRLSPEEKEDLAFARQIKTERKNQAIVKITANTRNKFSKEQLNGMSLDVLTNMAELAAGEEAPVEQQRNTRRPLYLGAAAPISNSQGLTDNAEQDKEDVLSMIPPTINYAELANEHRSNDKSRQRQLAGNQN